MNSVFLMPGCGACGHCGLRIILPTHRNPYSRAFELLQFPLCLKSEPLRGAQFSQVPSHWLFQSQQSWHNTTRRQNLAQNILSLVSLLRAHLTFLQILLFSHLCFSLSSSSEMVFTLPKFTALGVFALPCEAHVHVQKVGKVAQAKPGQTQAYNPNPEKLRRLVNEPGLDCIVSARPA